MKKVKSMQKTNQVTPQVDSAVDVSTPFIAPDVFAVGDKVTYSFWEYKVVEVINDKEIHIKNIQEPFDSAVVYNTQVTKVQ
jgi:hypothetical protein